MTFSRRKTAIIPSALYGLALLAGGCGLALGPLQAAECDGTYLEYSVIVPLGEAECRVDVSGPQEAQSAPLPPAILAFPYPADTVSVDLCGSWPTEAPGIDREISFAELEYYSDSRDTPSTVLVFTAAQVNGTRSLVVDLLPTVPRGWSLANPANQLPATPIATLPLPDCKSDTAAPFLSTPFTIWVEDGKKVKISRNSVTLLTTPRSMRQIYPGSYRVSLLRHLNANGSTVARTSWRAGS
ncbi:MAG: hypothetical protein IPK27_13825 [Rhodanobacteraceae bacterium]|nr:hypothetical protein [Rhodanobacteraceae bacterium]